MEMETCQRCGEDGFDRRTLRIECLYNLSELDIPWKDREPSRNDGYRVRICKECRASFLRTLETWWKSVEPRESTGTGVFVRGHGANRELTQEEVDEMRKERDVFKVSEDGDGIEVLEKTT
jgi:hypothetical protein